MIVAWIVIARLSANTVNPRIMIICVSIETQKDFTVINVGFIQMCKRSLENEILVFLQNI